ncbi:MAG: DUF938 domain-containing protein [Pseudomonadota bacterium]
MFSPSVARNKDVIAAVLEKCFAPNAAVLEIASGSGEHSIAFAKKMPGATWFPGDPNPEARASINAWRASEALENIRAPHKIDAAQPDWSSFLAGDANPAEFDGVVSINMIHIAPFSAAKGLFAGASRHLKRGGFLFLYGPFKRDGRHTAPSNEDFDASLKARDPNWGVRDLESEVVPLGEKNGFTVPEIVDMPANNLSVIFRYEH